MHSAVSGGCIEGVVRMMEGKLVLKHIEKPSTVYRKTAKNVLPSSVLLYNLYFDWKAHV